MTTAPDLFDQWAAAATPAAQVPEAPEAPAQPEAPTPTPATPAALRRAVQRLPAELRAELLKALTESR